MILLLTPLPTHARWESTHDNKSSSELAVMTDEQLFNEAFDVCVRRALLESFPNADESRAGLAECNDYLNTIYPFVRERNGGRVPAWMSALVTAHTTKGCQAAFHTFLSKTEKPATAAEEGTADDSGGADDGAPPRPQPTPKAHHPRSHWSEQLPPWLAPAH